MHVHFLVFDEDIQPSFYTLCITSLVSDFEVANFLKVEIFN